MLISQLQVAVLTCSVALSLSGKSCPPTLPVQVCEAACGPVAPCASPRLCCPTACGGSMCVDGVTERHFVNLEKKGRCPESGGGAWVCAHTCTGDADCPRALKCCPNRCGALACQRPDLDTTISETEMSNLNNI